MSGVTVLMMATTMTTTTKEREKIVKMLLSAGADPRATIPGGKTPLQIAASNGHAAIVIQIMKAEGGAAESENGEKARALKWANARIELMFAKDSKTALRVFDKMMYEDPDLAANPSYRKRIAGEIIRITNASKNKVDAEISERKKGQ